MAHNDTRITTLADRFNDMTPVEQDVLKALHAWLRELKQNPRTDKYDPVQTIEDIEYTLQAVWGFSRDRDYHMHWMELEGCTCPQLDNSQLMGAPYRFISDKCPHHKPEKPF